VGLQLGVVRGWLSRGPATWGPWAAAPAEVELVELSLSLFIYSRIVHGLGALDSWSRDSSLSHEPSHAVSGDLMCR